MIAHVPSFSPLPEEISTNTDKIYVGGWRQSPLSSLNPEGPFFRPKPGRQWCTRPIRTVPEPLSNGAGLLDTQHEFLAVFLHQNASLTLSIGTSPFIFSSCCQWSLTWFHLFFLLFFFFWEPLFRLSLLLLRWPAYSKVSVRHPQNCMEYPHIC